MNTELVDAIFNANPTLAFCELFNGMSSLWNYDLHRHPYIELIYRKSGHGKTDLLGETQSFTYFDTLVYPVDCWHQDKFSPSVENEAYSLWIIAPEVKLDKSLHVQDREGKLGYLFQSIDEEYKKEEPSEKLISLMLRSLMLQILFFSEEDKSLSMIDRVIQYLNANMTEKITVAKLSNISFKSKSALSKQFKQETGKTIIEYLNHIRVERAKTLLLTTSKTVNEIGFLVGFSSPKYFLRVFKSIVGVSPSNYVKQMRDHT